MNRRTALLSSLFLGGLVPPSLLAQTPSGRRIANREDKLPGPVDDDSDDKAAAPKLPGALPQVRGFELKKWDISRYTSIPTNVQAPPQKALIDWILLRTGVSEWHGDDPAVLSADRKWLTAYNSPEVLKQVDEIVSRFVEATADTLRIQVQFIAAVDPRWRYTVYSRLTYVGGGPQGQQIWTMKSRDAALVLTQIQIQQGFRPLAKEGVEMINGQSLLIKTREPRTFVGGLTQDPAGGIAFQPRPEKIDEGIILKLSPLLNYDGNAVDAKIDLTVNTVRTLHRTKVIAPRRARRDRDDHRRARRDRDPSRADGAELAAGTVAHHLRAGSTPASWTRRAACSTCPSRARSRPPPRSSSSSTWRRSNAAEPIAAGGFAPRPPAPALAGTMMRRRPPQWTAISSGITSRTATCWDKPRSPWGPRGGTRGGRRTSRRGSRCRSGRGGAACSGCAGSPRSCRSRRRTSGSSPSAGGRAWRNDTGPASRNPSR